MSPSVANRGIPPLTKVILALLTTSMFSLMACGTTSPKPIVLPVGFTDINGKTLPTQPSSLIVRQGSYVMVKVTDDTGFYGVDWNVSCQSALPPGTPLPPGQTEDLSCGSFTPTHTMSGPVPQFATSANGYVAFYTAPAAVPKGGTVTLIASATVDHTRSSSVTLNILP